MKVFNKYIAGALIFGSTALGLQSCGLDEYNPSGETADEVLATPQGMEYLTNQMYYWLRAKYFGREDPCLYMEGSSDLWQNIGSNYEYGMQLTRCVDLQGDRGQIGGVWDRLYDDVNNANAIINRLDKCVGLTEAQAKDFEGEARFIRSYAYWWLVEFFGDIELRKEETQSAVFSAVRTPAKQIYDEVILPDAEKASNLLPVQPYNGNVGRPTAKAAKAFYARVLLTRASYEAEGSAEQNAFLDKAYTVAKSLMDNKSAYGIALYNTYDEIWQAKNNKTNTEYLWVNSFSSNSALDADTKPNRLHMYYTPNLTKLPGVGSDATWEYPKESGFKLAPTYYLMNLWKDWDARYDAIFQEEFRNDLGDEFDWNDKTDGLPWITKLDQPDEIKKTTVDDQETILYFTKRHLSVEEEKAFAKKGIATVDIDKVFKTEAVNSYGGAPLRNCNNNYGVKEVTEEVCSSYPRFRKFRIYDGECDAKGNPIGTTLLVAPNGQFGYADAEIMRYAEVPLIAAECAIRLGKKPDAVNIIKQEIRNQRIVKAGHTLAEAQADVTESNMTIDWIMEERARELCGEYLRWFDLKRVYGPQGKFAEIINGRNPAMVEGTVKGNARQEYHKLWPIPITFLDKLTNPEEFGQNPGYAPFVKKK